MHKTPKIITNKKFFDKRGFLTELSGDIYIKKNKIKNILLTSSKKNVLRGFHFQRKKPINQIVTCIKGKILDVVVDLRRNSKNFGKTKTFILSENHSKSLFVPGNFAHGYLSLGSENIIMYLQDEQYIKKYDSGIIWNDPTINFEWPVTKPIISEKDKNLSVLKDAKF
tara:strand:- start:9499 stop:10002 length:504 start_codon:yes stop_codon:yes gene_type:complete